jgi:hypothetical protein
MKRAMLTARRHLLLPLAALTVLSGALLSAAGNAAGTAADGLDGLVPGSPGEGIYGSNHLARMPDKAELIFDYRFEGTAMEKPFSDDVLLDFTRHAGEDRGFDVELTIFPQSRKQRVGPVSATNINPILLVFFQRDVTHMSNGTGGSQHYFRNVIRRVLQTPDEDSVRAVTIDLDGRQVAAREVSFRPFEGDSHRAQLRGFADKTYRVIVSEAVPGGIYEVQSETPDEKTGEVRLRETYRFRELRQ